MRFIDSLRAFLPHGEKGPSFSTSKVEGASEALEKRIGYSFHNKKILSHALSHRSHAVALHEDLLYSNERLEFLGDTLLGFIAGEYLYNRYPQKLEGDLSRIKSLIISRKALKEAADRIQLSESLILARSEEKTGGRTRFSINSNAFEALIAAIYLDGGLEPAKKFIHSFVLSLLDEFLKDEEFVNYKSQLLERVQQKKEEIPHYTVMGSTGPDHDKTFTISVSFWGKPHGEGSGKTKKEAEQNAAKAALEKLAKPA